MSATQSATQFPTARIVNPRIAARKQSQMMEWEVKFIFKLSHTCINGEQKSKCSEHTHDFIGYDIKPDDGHDEGQGHED